MDGLNPPINKQSHLVLWSSDYIFAKDVRRSLSPTPLTSKVSSMTMSSKIAFVKYCYDSELREDAKIDDFG